MSNELLSDKYTKVRKILINKFKLSKYLFVYDEKPYDTETFYISLKRANNFPHFHVMPNTQTKIYFPFIYNNYKILLLKN